MISQRQIQRMIECGAYRKLVTRVLANGRCQSETARVRLARADAAAPAGLGLALQRLCELAYGPCPTARDAAERLLRLQRRDGLFGVGADGSIAATAVVLRGLHDWAITQPSPVATGRAVRQAIDIAMNALIKRLTAQRDPLPDQTDVAVLLWQLGTVPAFRKAAPPSLLAMRGGADGDHLRDDDLRRFARAAAA